jgi:hypothetical protein
LLSRSAILPSPTRGVGRNHGPVPPEGSKPAGRGWVNRDCLLSAEGGGGVRDRIWEEEGTPQEVERDHGLVLALRRNRAMIPRIKSDSHQRIGG